MGRGKDVWVIGVGKLDKKFWLPGDRGRRVRGVRVELMASVLCIFLGCENGRGPLVGVGWSILYSRKGLELRLSELRGLHPHQLTRNRHHGDLGFPEGGFGWSEVGSWGVGGNAKICTGPHTQPISTPPPPPTSSPILRRNCKFIPKILSNIVL